VSDASFLGALQLSDSALPIGRFVHSHGLESWLADRDRVDPTTCAEWVKTVVSSSAAPLDVVATVHAHRADTISSLVNADHWLTARKLSPGARDASQTCGRKLAALGLAGDDELNVAFAREVQANASPGNLAVVEGALARALGLTERQTALMVLRGLAAAILSAAVRLGALPPSRAQLILAELHPTLQAGADTAVSTELSDAHASAIELDCHLLLHSGSTSKLFAT